MDEDVLQRVAKWLQTAKSCIAFTGAGISTESGIPDFRTPGGVWSKYQPVYFDDFMASADARLEYWRQKSESHDDMAVAVPNTGHDILARWESSKRLRGVITQNIDGLHQRAGSRCILELHGTARQIMCLDCGARFDAEELVAEFRRTLTVPPCRDCGGRLKHATVSFGQALPQDVLSEALEWSRKCELILAMGSSLLVTPAADLPQLAKRSGARLVIINADPTGMDHLADAVVHTGIGSTLTAIDNLLPN